MSKRKGKSVVLGSAVAALVVLLAGAVALKDWIREEWYLWKLFEPLGRNAQGLREFRHPKSGIVFVKVPGGVFWMGAQSSDPKGPNHDPDACDDEVPVHRVTLSGFLLGKCEVTQMEWRRVTGTDRPLQFKGENPVDNVSWEDCQQFLSALGALVERGACRLPTEAEWEYACRAGTRTPFCCGEAPDSGALGDHAWYRENSGEGAHPVGGKRPNPWGLHDMHGNVWEWCQSLYRPYPYDASDGREAADERLCCRVLRGGSWSNPREICRTAFREGTASGDQGYVSNMGLRVVVELRVRP